MSITHIVLFQFKPDVSNDVIKDVCQLHQMPTTTKLIVR